MKDKILITAKISGAGPDWPCVHLHISRNDKSYKLGTLTPHAKDLPELIAGFQQAGWQVEAEKWEKIQDSAGD